MKGLVHSLMIIGIDDSGDFNTDSISFYAAVFIRPKKYNRIIDKFLEWESSLPSDVRKNGEVKGYLLNNNQLEFFADKILKDNGYGTVKLAVFGIEINESNTNTLIHERKHILKQIKDGTDKYYRNEGKEFTVIRVQYDQMRDWFLKKQIKTLYKIKLLGVSIVKSFNLATIDSVHRNFDRELGRLTVSIDKGVIGKESSRMYWDELLRSDFWSLSSTVEPMIHSKHWKPNHPYIKRFMVYPNATESLVEVNRAEINKVFSFEDSKDKPEIRMADIVASSFFRYYGKNERDIRSAIYKMKSQFVLRNGDFVLIGLVNKRNPNAMNPYTDKFDGVTLDDLREKYR